jgi:hypothetical protein
MAIDRVSENTGQTNEDWFRNPGGSANPGNENPCKDRVQAIRLELDQESLIGGKIVLGKEFKLRLRLEPVKKEDDLKGLNTFAVLKVTQGPKYRVITQKVGEFLEHFGLDTDPVPLLIRETGSTIYHEGTRLGVYGITYVDGLVAEGKATIFTRPDGEPYIIRATLWIWNDELTIDSGMLLDPPAPSASR